MWRLLCFLAVVFCSTTADAARVAFVVGNAQYSHASPLKNPVNDARLISKTLRSLGFEVWLHTNLSRDRISSEFSSFLDQTRGADTTLFYFAGHGLQYEQRNYLLGTDAKLATELDIPSEALDLDRLIRMIKAGSKAALVFIDACRDNPLANELFRKTMSPTRALATRGLAKMESDYGGAMITFSASPGQVAFDGSEANSPFAQALAANLPREGQEILSLTKPIIRDVLDATGGRQKPVVTNDLTTEIFLKPAAAPQIITPDLARPVASDEPTEHEQRLYAFAQEQGTADGYRMFLHVYPNSRLERDARRALERLQAPPKASLDSSGDDKVEPSHETAAAPERPGPALEEAEQESATTEADESVQTAFLANAPTVFRRTIPMIVQDRRAVQTELNRKGFDAGPVDGVFGRRTREAIAKFQERNGLPTTGIVMSATADAFDQIDLVSHESVPETYTTRIARRYTTSYLASVEDDPRLIEASKYLQDMPITYGFFDGRVYIAVMIDSHDFGILSAQNLAERMNGHVASINSASENDFVYELVRHDPNFWFAGYQETGWSTSGPFFGLRRERRNEQWSGRWVWVTGEPVRYTNWLRGQPDNYRGRQYMARFQNNRSNGPAPIPGKGWADSYGTHRGFIIEIE